MKLVLCMLALLAFGCGSSNTSVPVTMTVSDAGVDSAIVELPQVGNFDSGVQPDWCVSQTIKPTAYANLFEHDCVGSDGTVSITNYYDSALKIYCNWNTGTDMTVRCLPNNWESSFSYADDSCAASVAIGLDQAKPDGSSDTGYLGVEVFGDAGISIEVHLVGDKYTGGNPVYYKLLNRATGLWSCESTYIKLTGIGLFYVGKVVSPSIFTRK